MLLAATLAGSAPKPTEGKIVFIASSDAEAYSEALQGFQSVFPSLTVVVLDPKDPAHTPALRTALAAPVSVVIAAGSEALNTLAANRADAPLIATMVLHHDERPPGISPAAAVHLDIPFSQIVSEMAGLFPSMQRIVAIRNPGEGNEGPMGSTIRIVSCARPEDLLNTFLSLRGKADFALTTPDASLYNSVTAKPLILASLEHRLPIIGFSANFVRSGAAAGVYPDFRDIGQQTAILAQKLLAGQVRTADEGPRTVVVAVNQRVLRILGINYRNRTGLVVFR